ncbi:MAG TPA: recombination factor protein RarA, partial [Burkholderiaceae bacterium]
YAHDEPEGFAAGETYWPDGLQPQRFYQPVDRGLEQQIAERLARLRGLNEHAAQRAADGDQAARLSTDSASDTTSEP